MAVFVNGLDENVPMKKVSYTDTSGKTRYTLKQDPLNVIQSDGTLPRTDTGSGKASTGSGNSASTPIETGSSNSFDMNAYLSALYAERRAAAQAAYERNMNRIRSGYESAYGSLKGNYDSAVGRLNAARDKSMGDVNSDAENSLRQAYINNMMTRKNLDQRLSAMGYNGGATESTMAKLENQYGNSRTGINETLNKNIADLNMTYGNNLAQALESFNSAKANLDLQRMQMEMNAENALSNAESSAVSGVYGMDSSYLAALQNAINNQGNYTYDATKATNDYIAGNAQQAASAAEGSNYAKYLEQAMLEASQGGNLTSIKNNLFNNVRDGQLDIDTLYRILQKLGAA